MRRFENSIKNTKENLKECEALILEYANSGQKPNKKPLSEEDVNHSLLRAVSHAKVYGFDSDEYTKEAHLRVCCQKYLLAINRILYWLHN